MEATVLQTPLLAMQQFVLHIFAVAKSDRKNKEITSLCLADANYAVTCDKHFNMRLAVNITVNKQG